LDPSLTFSQAMGETFQMLTTGKNTTSSMSSSPMSFGVGAKVPLLTDASLHPSHLDFVEETAT